MRERSQKVGTGTIPSLVLPEIYTLWQESKKKEKNQ